jgi:double-strand break repair protein AddB
MADPKLFTTPGPRLFALPPGVDFPQALIDGLRARLSGAAPEDIARVEIYVATDRMRRRMRAIFDRGAASLLPRIRLVTDLADPLARAELPTPIPPLRRRLELTNLVARLLDSQPDLAPRAALFDLSDSLASLMEEMHGENVPPEVIEALDVSDQSGHWQRALQFFNIVQRYFEEDAAPDMAGFTRRAMAMRLAQWAEDPPRHPILIAGSTGSRGTTHAFMSAVAKLPQGAVILPGFDPDMPQSTWDRLDNPLTGEDHPQYRFAKIMRELDLNPRDVKPWTNDAPPSPARNAVLSLALRPAPVTHQWLSEGPKLPDLPQAMEDVTLLEAPSQREEALAIALRLRQAAEDGITAALITPDRMLTRQVTSALDRWGILPDDSAGTPLHLTPPGRLIRLVADLFRAPLTAERLLSVLKHPLTHADGKRGQHRLNTSDLELHIRKTGMPYPTGEALRAWGEASDLGAWGAWIADRFCHQDITGPLPLTEWIDRLVALTEAISTGTETDSASELWKQPAGRALRKAVDALSAEARHGADMGAQDFCDLFYAILTREEVRDRDAPHPHILIWGTLEARVMGADLLILGGLNEGSWPEAPPADPWLNRPLRAKAGLLLPERRIGLSAHDFQQAAAGKEVWLTRSLKSDDAETVPSRWVNRLMNLMSGLPQKGGKEALKQMKARGAHWLDLAEAAEQPIPAPPAPRPAPAPPVTARPKELSVTEIKRLIRDPYAIYAKHVLRLREIDPLMQAPDALLRGILIHSVIEDFVKETVSNTAELDPAHLSAIASGKLEDIPFPTVRALWQARVNRFAPWFCASEEARRAKAKPARFEITGRAEIPELGFTLKGTADRIDLDDRAGAHLYDYKTGGAPSEKEQLHFDKQLLLEAAMLLNGAFPDLAPRHIESATYIQLKPGDPKEVGAPLLDSPPEKTWAQFTALIAAYMDPEKGYTARRALMKDADIADYDHLSRFGEWDVTDEAEVLELK